MKVVSVQQPWAQLLADRRRHILIKNWTAEPGSQFALHASHVVNESKCREFEYDPERVPRNAILGIIEVKRTMPRLEARPSKFDYHSAKVKQRKLYAIVVRTIEKFRNPIPIIPPVCHAPVWECEIGRPSATHRQENQSRKESE